MTNDALLVFEDGTHARGRSIGATGTAFGEVVFNTSMTGYQEVLTDPSYRGQIVTMTTAHVGNYGMNDADQESDLMQVSGFVVREAARQPSSWRAQRDLRGELAAAGIVAIEGVDTRAITRHVREQGAMRAAISTEILDADALVADAAASPMMEGAELASEVTTAEPYVVEAIAEMRHRVVVLDFGMKRSIARDLARCGAQVHVLPSSSDADDVLACEPDGVLLSNGPGDPAAVRDGIATTQALLGRVPVFGICLGSQLLGHALGARTYKLRFGHHGVNQPVQRRLDGAVEITSHNHGFAVDPETFGETTGPFTYNTADFGSVEVSHVNLNDGVCEGVVASDVRAFSVQYHPEAAPGPSDASYLFDRFAAVMSGDISAISEGR
ncbi:MAG: glutamine-hydrolyzing carbamoyl-phosphate synthase small subunit [Nitriliruptoraceae bacterium]